MVTDVLQLVFIIVSVGVEFVDYKDVADINMRQWDRYVAEGRHYCQPLLNLPVEEYVAFGKGERHRAPEHYNDWEDSWMPRDLKGKDVLCLASGGGWQSAQFGLMGSDVTVVDICQGQLDADLKAAEHYGYSVKTILGDMHDLSMLKDASFDMVIQGVSLVFSPDVSVVLREVYRVLRPDGLYYLTHPESADSLIHWDGSGYRMTEPAFLRGPIRVRPDGIESMLDGEMTGEFRHPIGDLFGAIARTGFIILDAMECAPNSNDFAATAPGSNLHKRGFHPSTVCIVARKNTS